MDRIRDLQLRHSQALERMEAIATDIESLDASTDIETIRELERRFNHARGDADAAKRDLSRAEQLIETRSTVLNADPAPEWASGSSTRGSARVRSHPRTYDERAPHSFFRDLFEAHRFNDPQARARLERHREEMRVEHRDLSSTLGAGGDFIPPVWLTEDWVDIARPSRPFANAVTNLPLPDTGASINVPKLLTGAATAAQADLGAVQETDPTTGSTTVPVKTLAGQVDLSRQSFERSAPGLDMVLFDDLTGDHNQRLDLQTLTGSGSGANAKGVLSDANRIITTWTQASPTVALFFNKVADAAQQVATQRLKPATHIVMHPRRWAWITAASDTTGRPLIVPNGSVAQNSPGAITTPTADGEVGLLQNLRVIIDANIPTNLGAGTNEDIVIVTRAEDNYLWERPGGPVLRVYEEVLSGNLAVRLQAYSYFAFTSELRSKANATVTGTGLVPPSFPS